MRSLGEIVRAMIERRSEIVGINRRNVELVYPHNPREHYPLADDKLLTKELLLRAGVAVPPTLAVCEGLFAVPNVMASLETEEDFVVKPANGSGGSGILVLGGRRESGGWRQAGGGTLSKAALERHLADIVFGAHSGLLEDRAFVERRIEPHELFETLWKDGLSDIRVLTLKGRPVMAMIRVPTSRSRGRANLHQGGLGLAVDLGTGRTFRAVSFGVSISRHPESGSALIGLEVPGWREVLEVARRAALAVPLGYLGIDVVVDRRSGPLILEINVRPGLEIQNVNGRGLRGALREAFD